MALTKFGFKVSGNNAGSSNIHCSVSINGTEVVNDVEITGTAGSQQDLAYSLDCADATNVDCILTVLTGNADALGYVSVHDVGTAKAYSDGKYYQGIYVGQKSEGIGTPWPEADAGTVQIDRPVAEQRTPSSGEIAAGVPNPLTKYRVKETALYNWSGNELNIDSYTGDTTSVAIQKFVSSY